MSERPTDDQLARLPKYAQEYITSLERKHREALECARKLEDDQTPTKVKTTSFEHIDYCAASNQVTRYFDCDHLEIEHKGVKLTVGGLFGNTNMRLGWGPAGSLTGMAPIVFMPTAYQQAELVNLAYAPDEYQRLLEQKKREDERHSES